MTDHPSRRLDDTGPAERIVYVRRARKEFLPEELREATQPIYSLHAANGAVLALAPSRPLAFAMARRSDLTAFSVH
ncbi:MAG: DUF1150 family protein [Pseudomonadota bacterium]